MNERLLEARKVRRKTRNWLAEQIGVHASTIARWEKRGGELPPLEAAFALSAALDVSLRWLTHGNPPYMERPELAWREEATLLHLYRRLNPAGQKAMLETLKDAVDALTTASAREP